MGRKRTVHRIAGKSAKFNRKGRLKIEETAVVDVEAAKAAQELVAKALESAMALEAAKTLETEIMLNKARQQADAKAKADAKAREVARLAKQQADTQKVVSQKVNTEKE